MVGRRSFSFREKAYFQVQAVSFREGQYYLFPPHDPKSTTRTSLHVWKQVAVVQSFTRRDIYLDIVGFQPQQTQEILDCFCEGGVKNGAKQCVWSIFLGDLKMLNFPMDLWYSRQLCYVSLPAGYFHNYLARWWFQWLCQFWFLFLMEKPFIDPTK